MTMLTHESLSQLLHQGIITRGLLEQLAPSRYTVYLDVYVRTNKSSRGTHIISMHRVPRLESVGERPWNELDGLTQVMPLPLSMYDPIPTLGDQDWKNADDRNVFVSVLRAGASPPTPIRYLSLNDPCIMIGIAQVRAVIGNHIDNKRGELEDLGRAYNCLGRLLDRQCRIWAATMASR